MSVEFFETIRGVEIEVIATDFDGDESAGISYGPETIAATRVDDGSDFELTDEETEMLGIQAAEIYYDRGADDCPKCNQ